MSILQKISIYGFSLLIFSCEEPKRDWDNPYDPNSDRATWTPTNLKVEQERINQLKLSWLRQGRDFDGFRIDKKIGENTWIDSVGLVWDSTFTWIDTIDTKLLVQRQEEYLYRLRAYADTNLSNPIFAEIIPLKPNNPQSVDISSVTYTFEDPKTLNVSWYKNLNGAFRAYHLYHADNRTGIRKLEASIIKQDSLKYFTDDFSVLQENWFWVEVEDTNGQKSIGQGMGIPPDPLPKSVNLDTVKFNSSFNLKWSKAENEDFKQYIVEATNINSGSVILETVEVKDDTSFQFSSGLNNEYLFKIINEDSWGQSVPSNGRYGTSYSKIVKIDSDELSAYGDPILIQNIGPALPFTKPLSNLSVYFPFWIQEGKKIFTFVNEHAGLVIGEDGTEWRTIAGEVPKNIALNSNQSMAVYEGADHNIYLVNLESDQGSVRITNTTNNEWYYDPEFIEDGNKILYSQRKHQSNNNVGVTNVFTMDLDGLNIIKITEAPDVDKFIMPRLNPAGNKMLYTKEDDGLYILNYPNQTVGIAVLKEGNEKVVPESSKYFRNIRWSPDGSKAVIWSEVNGTYFLYIFDNTLTPPLKLLHTGGRYGHWISNDTILFRSESSNGSTSKNAMYTKSITAEPGDSPVLFYDAPWAQPQPRD